MALLPVHKYFIHNDELLPVADFISAENEGGVYEVLRVEKGVPLFLEDHLARFYRSAEIAGYEVRYSGEQTAKLLQVLTEKNHCRHGNILVSCKTNFKAFFIRHSYPSVEMYRDGVECGLLYTERQNPNAKVFQTNVRQLADDLIGVNNFYEVLLVDHFGKITEGSRSNVFFVEGNELITPPGRKVLLGITRQKTFLLARNLKINLRETDVELQNIGDFDAVFLTGTSPKILPVRSIGHYFFNPLNERVIRLMHAYDELIKNYVKKFGR